MDFWLAFNEEMEKDAKLGRFLKALTGGRERQLAKAWRSVARGAKSGKVKGIKMLPHAAKAKREAAKRLAQELRGARAYGKRVRGAAKAVGAAGLVGGAYAAGQSGKEEEKTSAAKNPCPTPGEKIRSKGKGRGLARGKGKGPIGVPIGEKIEGETICPAPGRRARSAGRGRGLGRGGGRGPMGRPFDLKEELKKKAAAPAAATPTNDAPAAVNVVRGGGIQGAKEGNGPGYTPFQAAIKNLISPTPKLKTNEKDPATAPARKAQEVVDTSSHAALMKQAAEMVRIAMGACPTPGKKIRSKGKGEGKARGKGKGPMGIPVYKKIEEAKKKAKK